MKKVFKTKRKKIISIKSIIYIIIVYYVSLSIFNFIPHDYLFIENPIFNFKIDRNKFLLKVGLNYKEPIKSTNIETVFDEISIKPTIYLYSTHQGEKYNNYSVLEASKYLKEELVNNNIDVIMDDIDIESIIKTNGLLYKDSYKITRDLIKKQDIEKIDLFIDLHRDSSKKNVTTTKIDDKNYAKVMFVSGGSFDTYMENYKVMDNINKLIKNINPSLSRGIFLRKSSNYNQDINNNIILIELGGVENTEEEVKNTIRILCKVLIDYLNN